MDKEGEIYDKLLSFPNIKDPNRRNGLSVTSQQHMNQETLLFKAPAIKLRAFLARRQVEKRELADKIKV